MATKRSRSEIDDIIYDYEHNRAGICTRAELVTWWHWAHKAHADIYKQLVYGIKVEDSLVDMVRQRLLKHGY